jgi:hypothetical protein
LIFLLLFMAKLLQGSTWRGWVIRRTHNPDIVSKELAVFQDISVPIHTAGTISLMVWRAWRWTSASSMVMTVTRFEHHWTTLVSLETGVRNRFRISKATWRCSSRTV